MAVSRLLCDPSGAPRKLARKLPKLPHKKNKMFAFCLGVACGAKKCLYFTPKVTVSHYCWF